MSNLDYNYWNTRWTEGQTGWDIGDVSPAIKEYIDTLTDKKMRILIPGCGNGYEGSYLHHLGFTNVFLMDLSELPLNTFARRNPDFPKEHLITGDFFKLEMQFDLVIEQTFFCALNPSLREAYCAQMKKIISPSGRLAGLLFNKEFEKAGPPFGGSAGEYQILFGKYFRTVNIVPCLNSIPPRQGSEVFFECRV